MSIVRLLVGLAMQIPAQAGASKPSVQIPKFTKNCKSPLQKSFRIRLRSGCPGGWLAPSMLSAEPRLCLLSISAILCPCSTPDANTIHLRSPAMSMSGSVTACNGFSSFMRACNSAGLKSISPASLRVNLILAKSIPSIITFRSHGGTSQP